MQRESLVDGPYRSAWATGDWYIVPHPAGYGWHVIVRDGQQPADGTMAPSAAEARAWMRENGYAPVRQ